MLFVVKTYSWRFVYCLLICVEPNNIKRLISGIFKKLIGLLLIKHLIIVISCLYSHSDFQNSPCWHRYLSHAGRIRSWIDIDMRNLHKSTCTFTYSKYHWNFKNESGGRTELLKISIAKLSFVKNLLLNLFFAKLFN